jgi:hypothetical protein
MNATNIYQVEVNLKVAGKPLQFFIYTNVVEYDIPFIWLVEDWAATAHSFTPRSFCKFIKRADPQFVAMTEKEFQMVMQATNN